MNRATRIVVAVMGAWMGFAGLEHGIGEVLQGGKAPEGIMIRSWPDAPFFRSLNGEPALTLLPNLLFTGLVAVLISLLFIGWSLFYAHQKNGGKGMMVLAIPMFIFGGGIFPPILGFMIGLAAHLAHRADSSRPANGLNRWLGKLWKWIFIACCLAWLALLPGVAILGYCFGIDRVGITLGIMAAAFSLLPLSFLSSLQHGRLTLESTSKIQ
jgi:hypothetical protein